MKLIDRLIHLSPEQADPGNSDYRMYRYGILGTALGAAAILGSVVAGSLGFEGAGETVAGGIVLFGLGSMAVIGGLEGMNQKS